ncbi:MAG: 5-(carboxyamino)imidazole ribonucleotide synthase [Acidobacteriota bacterium]|nr:5-(carboxyamino)imidazole ribonucleotide synthase [Acidobacteriota bacterium]
MSRTTTIGVIGGGQLARMMYAPAISLGVNLRLLAEGPEVGAARVIKDVVVGDYTDDATVRGFAADCDVITFDHEHVPTRILRHLAAEGMLVRPGPDALEHAQDKLLMRQRLTRTLAAPAPLWRHCPDALTLREFGAEIGWPIVAKASRGGYDGHGVWKLAGPQECDRPFNESKDASAGEMVEIIGEEYIDFARELSVLVVRSASGQAVSYPVTETVQREGVCRETITPAPGLPPARAAEITRLGLDIADELQVVGVLAVELMQRHDGSVVINELAMRPHNTGHWTIDGAHTSQFENHLRAVLDLPLGDPRSRDPWCMMVNVLGGGVDDLTSELLHCFARDPRLRVEFYGKQLRPGRKVGHVVCYGDDLAEVRVRAQHAARYLMGEIREG